MALRFPVILALIALFCSPPEPPGNVTPPGIPDSNAHKSESESWLSNYDLGDKDPQSFKLPKKLSEISGLAMTDDGRLFCHDDESAVVYELDYRNGKIIKRFSLGSGFLEEDFEGIAVKRDTFFLVTSSGDILEFQEGPDRGHVSFELHTTKLSGRYDIEGIEYDDSTNSLLLVCKAYPGKKLDGYKAIYAFMLDGRKLQEKPRYLIPLKEVKTWSPC